MIITFFWMDTYGNIMEWLGYISREEMSAIAKHYRVLEV